MVKRDYLLRIACVILISVLLFIVAECSHLSIIPMPKKDIAGYHMQILTISSVFCGFSLTNLTLLLEVHSESIAEKLKGTDLLQKRNISISYSIMFGAVSAFLSVFWVLKVNADPIASCFGQEFSKALKEVFFNLEIISLLMCMLYFMISSKQMIELLSKINQPQHTITNKSKKEMKNKIYN